MNNSGSFHDKTFDGLCEEYSGYIRSITYSFPERHREDLYQEGLVVLDEAKRSFDPSRGVPFDAFVKICIKRRIYTVFKTLRKNDETVDIAEEEISAPGDLEMDVVEKKYTEDVFSELRKNLTELEKSVLKGYLEDKSYAQIAENLGISAKTVDNTLVRIKNKIKKIFPENRNS